MVANAPAAREPAGPATSQPDAPRTDTPRENGDHHIEVVTPRLPAGTFTSIRN
jgi:hypothetical protein